MDHFTSSDTAWHTILLLKEKGEGQERKRISFVLACRHGVRYINRFICIFTIVYVQFSQHFSLHPFSQDERQV